MLTPDEKRKLIANLRPFPWVHPFATVKVEARELTELCDMAEASLEAAPSGEGALREALADAACILNNFSRGGSEQDVDDAAAWIDKYAPQYSDQALADRPLEAAKQGRRCICADGHPEDYEGPRKDCPIHGLIIQPPASQGGSWRDAYEDWLKEPGTVKRDLTGSAWGTVFQAGWDAALSPSVNKGDR